MDESTSRRRPGLIRTARLEAFSDGVFAIAVTLLVLDHADAVFVRLNLILLLLVALLPFPTRLLGEYVVADESERVAVTVYGVALMTAAIALALLWRYAVSARLIRDGIEETDLRTLSQRITPGIGGYAVLILVGLAWPKVALIGYLALAVFFLIPIRPDRRASRPDRA